MKPLTPAMIEALRKMDSCRYGLLICHSIVRKALKSRGLIHAPDPDEPHQWQLTDAGRRVLAEHTTTGDE